MSVTLGGFFSGMDTTSIINQLVAIQKIPITTLRKESVTLTSQNDAYGFLSSSMSSLKDKLTSLKDPELFRAVAASSSNTTVGTASADTTAVKGIVKIQVTAMSSQSSYLGSKLTSLPANGAVAASSVFSSGFAGTVNVNGTQVTIADSDTLDQIASKLSVAGVTAAYNSGTGKFEMAAASPIILATGSSNFFQQSQLFNNGTSSVTSSTAIGRTDTSTVLGLSGDLTINGVNISSITATDSLKDVLDKITGSEAGVIATYDNFTDQIRLTSKSRGSLDISVSGADAAALQLSTGSLSVGSDTRFKVNDGMERISTDTTLDGDELGVSGLTFTALSEGVSTVSLGADTSKVKSALNSFVEQYNSLQNMVRDYTKVDPNNSFNNGVLANESSLTFLPSDLRSLLSMTYGDGTYRMLEDLGIKGNSSDNTLTTVNDADLEKALNSNQDDLIEMFTDATNGFSAKMSVRLDAYATGTTSVVSTRQTYIKDRQTDIEEEIARIEAQVEAERQYLIAQFSAMESASGSNNQISSMLSGLSA